jgi:signal peptidase I
MKDDGTQGEVERSVARERGAGRPRLFAFRHVPRKERTLIMAAMLFWSVLSYQGISRWIIVGMEVDGMSMFPTLDDGERLVIHRWKLHYRGPQRGDVVAIRIPSYPSLSVKRIVGLPGERVRIRDRNVFVGGSRLAEPYVNPFGDWDGGRLGEREFAVAPSCYLVLGDNRGVSVDSRDFGAVHRDCIVGFVQL